MRLVGTASLLLLLHAVAAGTPANASPGATITAEFADGCRDLSVHSTKDISHVELRYRDGSVFTDESIASPDYTIAGSADDEIMVALVKSGRTRQSFPCDLGGNPPEALLEIALSPSCMPYTSGEEELFYWCTDGAANDQRTVMTDPGGLAIEFGCVPDHQACLTVTVRGSGSTDPDSDLAHWSVDFDDGHVVSGGWDNPPAVVTHTFAASSPCSFVSTHCQITLTVTDSGGRAATDSLPVVFYDSSPD